MIKGLATIVVLELMQPVVHLVQLANEFLYPVRLYIYIPAFPFLAAAGVDLDSSDTLPVTHFK